MACRPGTYKASSMDGYCSKCPPHSYSHQERASECACEKGYYRADMDPRSMPCTSVWKQCTVIRVYQQWENPSLQGILLGIVPGKASTNSGPPDQFFDGARVSEH
ncbi:hypothetical protein NFI96_004017 [Prochilodus magdalenae]|nr:hypothetical protein NFI96_004017 [Prochilodus magdalenae]